MSMMSSYPAMMAAYGGQQQPQQQNPNMRYGNPAQMNLQTGIGSGGFGQFNQMRPPQMQQPGGQPGQPGQQGGGSFMSQFPALLAAYQSRQQSGPMGGGAPPAQRMPNFNPNQSYQSAIGMGMRPQQTMNTGGTNFANGAGAPNPYMAGIISRAAVGAPGQMGGAGASPTPFRGQQPAR